jgi:Calcineurin-like phosphoesterase
MSRRSLSELNPNDRLETILERALTAYHRDEPHGGAQRIGERLFDAELVPIAREAFRDADHLPSDDDVLGAIAEPMQFLGEGYHVIALVESRCRFVVKYAKHPKPVPPLGAPPPGSRRDWQHEHAVRPDGALHPAIWQHIHAFESYGPLAVPSRAYIADGTLTILSDDERRRLERFRAIGIVRSLGSTPRAIRISYPADFPQEKQAAEGLSVSVVIVQPLVTPLAAVIERTLRTGDVAAARRLEARYDEFTQQLWHCGVSHLDFSILNIGIVGSGAEERLQIFDPHMGVIGAAADEREVLDPMSVDPSRERSVESILRSSRDGSRWALWRVQQNLSASDDTPPQATMAAADLVREFHAASEGLEEGRGSFGVERFERVWELRGRHIINTVMHAQMWALIRHPLGDLVRSVLDPRPDGVYDRSVAVLGMQRDEALPQFRAGLRVYANRPLLVVANVSEEPSSLIKHWGRLRLPEELDVQDDPAIHYHLRDLFTGEMYVRPGDDLARRGFVVGLAPHELHVLEVEDVIVEDMAAERSLAAHRDVSEFLTDWTKRVGVVGDVHGELDALKQIVRALGFIDAFDHWSARDGTLVLTGDVGHGRHLQEVFDFIHGLAAQAHRVGGRIVWTLGNHDLYVDREGGQGGEESLGYRLWPAIRESALHPERHPGLNVQAAYFEHDKLFVHGGVLPNIVELAMRERGARDAESVASYINDVLRRTLVDRERISARDLPHEIFHIGTSHTRERRMPGEIGYEPAGVFTPDLREVDHYRYHADLLPQVVGHTASRRGEIRYSPGSWLRREYIAIDVGRQHGTGNGGLLLTHFGWVAVTPGGPARFVEVAPLFVELARQAESEAANPRHDGAGVRQMRAYLEVTHGKPRTLEDVQRALFADLAPSQVVTIERFLAQTRQTRRCLAVTDLDEMLTAFSGNGPGEDTIEVLAEYLAAGGALVFRADTAFDWFYVRFLRPLIVELGARSPLLSNVVLMLSGGEDIFTFEDGSFRSIPSGASRDGSAVLEVLAAGSKERLETMPVLDPAHTVYIGDSIAPGGIDRAVASSVGFVIDVGDAMPETTGEPLSGLHRRYRRTIDTIVTITAAMSDSGRTGVALGPGEVSDTVLWTFEHPRFPRDRRVRVCVNGSGFVHAGIEGTNGRWTRVYNVPLLPLLEGGYEALLPPGVNVFTFFWTEAPWVRGHPGHWERGPAGARLFRAEWT